MRLMSLLISGLALLSGSQVLAQLDLGSFDWDSIAPAAHLEYHSCYEGFQCARLEVPLDWLDPNNTNTVAIAIVKRPAVVPETDPSHGGSILLNPGGPGGSGVMIALAWGGQLQQVIDENKHYEIIGFDPRGVSFTTPPADCYFDPFARGAFMMQVRGMGFLVPETHRLSRRYAMTNAYGRLCGENLGGEGGIMPFSSTASVARDMVAIIDEIELLREKEKKKATIGGPDQHPLGGDSEDAKPKGPARLQYLGFSYGTMLGNTFASMFPGRVGRLVIDGVVDTEDYMSGTWLKNLQDTDKIIDYFYQTCFDAGSLCALKEHSDKSWQDVRDRVESFMDGLTENPVPIVADTSLNFLTGVDVQSLIFISLYSPNAMFPIISMVINSVMKGDYSLIGPVLGAGMPRLDDVCPGPNGTLPFLHITPDAQASIACGDGEDHSALSVQDWADYIVELRNQSSYVGSTWSEIRFQCANWNLRPKYRFTGPFSTPEADLTISEGRPAAPLLFLSSRLDPVTPLRNAHAMAARHPGAAVLMQDSVGHCAVGSVPSKCTAKFLKAYFENGTVPEPGTVCEADCSPYKPCEMKTMGLAGSFVPPLGPPDMQDMWQKVMKQYETWRMM